MTIETLYYVSQIVAVVGIFASLIFVGLQVRLTWAQRLKRVFSIDIDVCGHCGGAVRVIACIEDQETIDRILDHLRQKEQDTAVAIPRLSLSSTGKVVYTLKTPYRDGTTQVAFKPVCFITQLVAQGQIL